MAIAGDGTCSEETFDGPTLLVLARDCPSDETQQLRTVSGLQLSQQLKAVDPGSPILEEYALNDVGISNMI